MANENTIVVVNVSLSGGGVTREGFGVPLLLSNTGNAWATPELTRSYTRDSFSTDFPATTVENAALTALFGQPQKPPIVLVGKGPTKPTRILKIGTIVNVNSTAYVINAWANGVEWQVTYTSDGTATVAEIVAGLVIALNAAAWVATTGYNVGDRVHNDTPNRIYQCITAGTSAGSGGPTGVTSNITDGTVHWEFIGQPGFTASATDTNSTVTCTGDASGNWFAIEPLASGDTSAVSNLMAITDTTTNPGVQTDLAAIYSANQTWYELTLLFKSSAIMQSVGSWANTNGRLLLATSADTACATTAFSGATDSLAVMAGLGYSYFAGMAHPRDAEFFDASKAGYFLPLSPGSDNWTYKSYAGCSPVNYTPTQQTNLRARRAAYYLTLGGLPLDGGLGQVESTTYLFIDVRRNVDSLVANLQADLLDLFIENNKVFHTNAGLQQIANIIAARFDISITAGILSGDPLDPANNINQPYTIVFPLSTTPGTFDPTTRAQTGFTATARLASAIDSITIQINLGQ